MPNQRQTFNQLSNPDKILAVLGIVRNPISPELALIISGIDIDQLDDTERSQIEGIFTGPLILRHDSPEYGPTYALAAQAKKDLVQIEWPSIQRELKNILIKGIFQK